MEKIRNLFVFFVAIVILTPASTVFGIDNKAPIHIDMSDLIEVQYENIKIRKKGLFIKYNDKRYPISFIVLHKKKYYTKSYWYFWKCCQCAYELNKLSKFYCENPDFECEHVRCKKCKNINLDDLRE